MFGTMFMRLGDILTLMEPLVLPTVRVVTPVATMNMVEYMSVMARTVL